MGIGVFFPRLLHEVSGGPRRQRNIGCFRNAFGVGRYGNDREWRRYLKKVKVNVPGSTLPRAWILTHGVDSQGSLMTLTLSVTGTAGTLLMRTRAIGIVTEVHICQWVMGRVIIRLNQRCHSYGRGDS